MGGKSIHRPLESDRETHPHSRYLHIILPTSAPPSIASAASFDQMRDDDIQYKDLTDVKSQLSLYEIQGREYEPIFTSHPQPSRSDLHHFPSMIRPSTAPQPPSSNEDIDLLSCLNTMVPWDRRKDLRKAKEAFQSVTFQKISVAENCYAMALPCYGTEGSSNHHVKLLVGQGANIPPVAPKS
ncbi:hypothetical protein QQ045_032112 [Rhodiola kirilowii]